RRGIMWQRRRERSIMRTAAEGVRMNSHRMLDVVALSAALALLWPSRPCVEAQASGAHRFGVDDILSMPQPDNLVASPAGSTIAWTFDERGPRNIYVADAPDFRARRLTSTTDDDGQELTQLAFSHDGRTIVYVRGGDHGSNRGGDPPNP